MKLAFVGTLMIVGLPFVLVGVFFSRLISEVASAFRFAWLDVRENWSDFIWLFRNPYEAKRSRDQ